MLEYGRRHGRVWVLPTAANAEVIAGVALWQPDMESGVSVLRISTTAMRGCIGVKLQQR
jgi:hypothetical protein